MNLLLYPTYKQGEPAIVSNLYTGWTCYCIQPINKVNVLLYPTYIQGEPARQESIVSNLLECEVYAALSVLAKEKMYSSF